MTDRLTTEVVKFIEESKDDHPSSFKFWVRGYHPQVQTMGDGMIELFKDGKVVTMDARK